MARARREPYPEPEDRPEGERLPRVDEEVEIVPHEKSERRLRVEHTASTPPKKTYEPVRPREGTSPIVYVRYVVDYLFYVLYGLLGIRMVLVLLAASPGAPFVQLINNVTQPFYAPFEGIVARPPLNGGSLDLPIIIALLAYAVLHTAIRGLLRLLEGRAPSP